MAKATVIGGGTTTTTVDNPFFERLATVGKAISNLGTSLATIEKAKQDKAASDLRNQVVQAQLDAAQLAKQQDVALGSAVAPLIAQAMGKTVRPPTTDSAGNIIESVDPVLEAQNATGLPLQDLGGAGSLNLLKTLAQFQSKNKPVSVSGGSTLVDPQTGEVLFRNPKDSTNKTITLSPGAKAFNASGILIAENPKDSTKKTTVVPPGSIVVDSSGKVVAENVKPTIVKSGESIYNPKTGEFLDNGATVGRFKSSTLNNIDSRITNDVQSGKMKLGEATKLQGLLKRFDGFKAPNGGEVIRTLALTKLSLDQVIPRLKKTILDKNGNLKPDMMSALRMLSNNYSNGFAKLSGRNRQIANDVLELVGNRLRVETGANQNESELKIQERKSLLDSIFNSPENIKNKLSDVVAFFTNIEDVAGGISQFQPIFDYIESLKQGDPISGQDTSTPRQGVSLPKLNPEQQRLIDLAR